MRIRGAGHPNPSRSEDLISVVDKDDRYTRHQKDVQTTICFLVDYYLDVSRHPLLKVMYLAFLFFEYFLLLLLQLITNSSPFKGGSLLSLLLFPSGDHPYRLITL